MGSPGTGKSSIVALICFYVAIKEKVSVVWHRYHETGDEVLVTCLFDQGKYYEWFDRYGVIYESFCYPGIGIGYERCWFCIDGTDQGGIARRRWTNTFTLLATSRKFVTKGEGGGKQEVRTGGETT